MTLNQQWASQDPKLYRKLYGEPRWPLIILLVAAIALTVALTLLLVLM